MGLIGLIGPVLIYPPNLVKIEEEPNGRRNGDVQEPCVYLSTASGREILQRIM